MLWFDKYNRELVSSRCARKLDSLLDDALTYIKVGTLDNELKEITDAFNNV